MDILKAIVLGVVQGVTEFLPVSSSGHLVIASEILNFQEQGITFDVFLHLGTLCSIIVVFRKDLSIMIRAPFFVLMGSIDTKVKYYFWWDVYIVIATVPAAIAGIFFKEFMNSIFTNILVVYSMLLLTGVLMILTRYIPPKDMTLNGKRSFLIGCAQAIAIIPGLSRSGSTIFLGILMGINRETVAKFSFIMSIPVIVGAVILQVNDLINNPIPIRGMTTIFSGTGAAAISGYFSIVFLLDVVRENRLQWFGYYCLVVSSLGFASYFLA